MHQLNNFPSYRELSERKDAPRGSTWGLFGSDDCRGTLNLIGSDEITAASKLVREGRSFGLDYPLDTFDPPLAATRKLPEQSVFSRHQAHRDEFLTLYTQASSQIDGLRHRRHASHGFYNGWSDADVDDHSALGVSAWGDPGIVGRGVLVDLEGHYESTGREIRHQQGHRFTLKDLSDTCEQGGLNIAKGDMLVFNTGWSAWYLNLSLAQRAEVRRHKHFSGFEQDRKLIEWCWDHGVAGLFSDSYALEALPANPDSDFADNLDHGMMHQELLALMGYPIGELWRVDDLARHCRATGRYEFMLTLKPLNMPGGVGSPCNAIALM
ncbi:MAG: cyclase family protein [Micrococcaceae bacterium]